MPLRRLVKFDRFAFDDATGELWLDGVRVPLQPQPSRLLALLVSRPGGVVSREEIRAALWGDDVHVDFDRSLNFCVARLRSALGDNAAAPRFIETLPTRGYRWLVDADHADADHAEKADADHADHAEHADADHADDADNTDNAEDAEDAEDADPADRADNAASVPSSASVVSAFRRNQRASATRWVVAAGFAVAALIALGAYWLLVSGAPKVVVVPFQNETGTPDLARVAKGVSDATVVKLAESSGLRVIGNAGGARFSFRPPDMKALGQSLGAQYLVLGQLKRDDRRMRIVAHLIRVSDQTHLWAQTYDTDSLDLSQQAAVGTQIAAAVSARIGTR